MKTKDIKPIGTKVIVNTGGQDTNGIICEPKKNIHGHFWVEQEAYCIKFENGTSQYIGAEHLKLANE